jgi:hypothetical protein
VSQLKRHPKESSMDAYSFVPLRPRPRLFAIRQLLAEAHASLTADSLAELLLAVHRRLEATTLPLTGELRPRPTPSPAVRVYLRPIEVLMHGGDDTFPPDLRQDLLRYLDDVASRPRGAAAVGPSSVK